MTQPIATIGQSGIASSWADRYFQFLGTQYLDEKKQPKQPAKNRFIDVLREVHAQHVPRWNLSACVAGLDPEFSGTVWVWSDLHLFHANVIRYCQRPYEDVAEMNQALLDNCLTRVGPLDILVFGGDITMGDVSLTNDLLRKIPAYKINVLGNHDLAKRKVLDLAVDEVAACLELDVAGVPVFVSHYPWSTSALRPSQLNLHGHTHTSRLPLALGDGSRHINMSVEHTGFSPVVLKDLVEAHLANATLPLLA
jgi:calcineurin-like phosphoesterase family protein